MKHIKNNFIATLSHLYETSEINEIFYECVSHITGKSRSQIIMSLSDKASDEIVKQCDMLQKLNQENAQVEDAGMEQ